MEGGGGGSLGGMTPGGRRVEGRWGRDMRDEHTDTSSLEKRR